MAPSESLVGPRTGWWCSEESGGRGREGGREGGRGVRREREKVREVNEWRRVRRKGVIR